MSSAPSVDYLPTHPRVNNMFRNTNHRPLYWLPNTMCELAMSLAANTEEEDQGQSK
jgi:hypothetical protein